ncbi:hypothetical protein, partial [Pseudomonas carnis]|uniref:hypothetical protein n=1 Tax=Pseudomonas carnis TaxID=2487355 RepID=UPI001E5297A0
MPAMAVGQLSQGFSDSPLSQHGHSQAVAANGNHDAKRAALDLDLLVIFIWLLISGAPLNHAGR